MGYVVVGEVTIPADVVVLANGLGAAHLAATVGVSLSIHASPAVLLRFAAKRALLRHLIQAADLELRPALDGGVLSDAAYPDADASGIEALAVLVAAGMADLFAPTSAPSSLSAVAVERSMTDTDGPLNGHAPGVEGL